MKQTLQSDNRTAYHRDNITTTLEILRVILGQPQFEENDGGDKINFRWILETEAGDIFTVYDYKEYRPLQEDDMIEWHIGARTKEASAEGRLEIERAISIKLLQNINQ